MKIAIVHDWFVTYAGAERVIEQFLALYPEADVFSVVDFIPEGKREFLNNKKVTTSFIQRMPFAEKKYRNYLPLMPIAIEQLDLSQYNLILSSSHAVAKGILVGPNQLHISYVHSPMRYAWDLQHQYLKESRLVNGVKSFFARIVLHYMRMWDLRTANGVDSFIANSQFIAKRIFKCYRRKAKVIYPPVDVEFFCANEIKEDYYLTASRMVPYKKMDLIVEAFSKIGKKLIVIGEGPDDAKIRKMAKGNILFLGYQSDVALREYMAKARAFVFAAEEDFGIAPVEAQACGTPVIAYGKGGALETIIGLEQKQPTGVFFKEQNIASLIEAIHIFETNEKMFNSKNCRENSLRFSKENFKLQIEKHVANQVNMFFS